jgi:hypothetical protein
MRKFEAAEAAARASGACLDTFPLWRMLPPETLVALSHVLPTTDGQRDVKRQQAAVHVLAPHLQTDAGSALAQELLRRQPLRAHAAGSEYTGGSDAALPAQAQMTDQQAPAAGAPVATARERHAHPQVKTECADDREDGAAQHVPTEQQLCAAVLAILEHTNNTQQAAVGRRNAVASGDAVDATGAVIVWQQPHQPHQQLGQQQPQQQDVEAAAAAEHDSLPSASADIINGSALGGEYNRTLARVLATGAAAAAAVDNLARRSVHPAPLEDAEPGKLAPRGRREGARTG